MAHEFAKDLVDRQAGRAGAQIVATLVGGVLLVNAALAKFIFHSEFPSQALAMVAALLLGVPLVWRALKDLWAGHSHMDELAALAVAAAFAAGWYLEAGVVAFIMIISTLIEHRTALGAHRSIESLVRITPTRAYKLDGGGEVEVDAKELRPGDVVRVRPGDNIPGDGRIITGISSINQANITGESLPVDKSVGDEVFGGTINETSVLEIEITKAGKDTTLGRVQELILQAERTQTPMMRLIDRYSHWYTPTILMVVFIVFVFTKDASRPIAMLVLACPCAIILATPTAMVASLSAAMRLGIYVKKVGDLEAARNLTAMVFDKTGTLTTGILSVTRLNPAPDVDAADLLRAAATAEHNSRHPVARAIAEVAERARLEIPATVEFEEVAGRGVKAKANGKSILVGRDTWLKESGIDATSLDTSQAEGLSLLYVVEDGRLLGWVGLEDRTRPDAARAMDELRDIGLRKLVMVTGDRRSVAQRVAGEMHCTDVQAEVLPAQKLELVDQLKQQRHPVAVIGDGVNDAPALAAGDISVAMGAAGSDVAIHSASIALMNNNLNRVPFLVKLSRRLIRVVRQNLVFALVFVVVMQTLAAKGQIPVMAAAVLHLVSSVFVLFNSARLVREGENLADTAGAAPPPPSQRTAPAPAPTPIPAT